MIYNNLYRISLKFSCHLGYIVCRRCYYKEHFQSTVVLVFVLFVFLVCC